MNQIVIMTTINDLPVELLSFIFKYLGIKDLVKARTVCQIWRHFCDEQKIIELIIECRKGLKPKYKWYYTEKKIENDNVILMDVFNKDYETFKRKLLKLEILGTLKRLCVRSGMETHLLLNHLYAFTELNQLECDFHFESYYGLVISHPNIRILVFNKYYEDDNYVEINAEKLEVLKFNGYYGRINITWPESLIALETDLSDVMHNNVDHNFRKLSLFKNLEVIHTSLYDSDPIIVTHLTKLKIFKFLSVVSYFDDYQHFPVVNSHGEYAFLKSCFIELIKIKEQLGRSDLKIYHDDTELITIQQTRQFLWNYYSDYNEGSSDSNSDSEIKDDFVMIE